MKRVLACILVAIMILPLFASCNKDDDSTTGTTAATKQTSNTEQNKPDNEENDNNENNKENEDNSDEEENEENKTPEIDVSHLPESSEGLEFELNDDGKGYTVTGIGTCTDTEIVIGKYNNLPVTSIGGRAFEDCTSLTGITISDSVTSIGDCAFYNTAYYNNESNWDNGVLYIGNHLIKAKETISGAYTVKEGTKTIADYAFYECTGLTSITIPDSVTSIGTVAFDQCTGLEQVHINDISSWCNIEFKYGNPLYYANKLYLKGELVTNLIIPNSVTSIGDYAFYWCTGLTSVTIGNSVTSIGDYAFDQCTGLMSVTIGNSVTSIGDCAFRGCTELTSVTIPDSVTSIGTGAFEVCTGLTSITIPDGITSIGDYAFSSCTGLTSITVSEGNSVYHGKGNCLIETATKTLISGCKTSVIPTDGSVTRIGAGAFWGCDGLTSITIPNSVTSIGEWVFANCTGLTSITIPDSVTSIGGSAFGQCYGLTSITIPNSVTSIGDYAFYGCTGLTSITIPNSVTSIGYYAFKDTAYYNNESNWDNGVLYIGNHLIEAKKTISGAYTVKQGTKTIAGAAFGGCTGLTSITIPDSVTSIGVYAFALCTGLTSITIPDSVTSIGEWAFSSCTGLTSVTIPDSITSIGDCAFWDCTGLTTINFQGTKAEWETIEKGSSWNSGTDNYTVKCTDGDIAKADDN